MKGKERKQDEKTRKKQEETEVKSRKKQSRDEKEKKKTTTTEKRDRCQYASVPVGSILTGAIFKYDESS